MHKLLLEIPAELETARLRLWAFQSGDGPWYYEAARRNREHLVRYEAGNALMRVENEEDAEIAARGFAAAWAARERFFLAGFAKDSGKFAVQIFIGPADWDLPEFKLGYFADVDHEGRGYATEAARAALGFIFAHLGACRVSLECDETNLRSQRVAERCGFVREGLFRENRRRPDGTISGTMHYGMLREEFERD